MMWAGVGVQWARGYALILDGMMSHRMTGPHHPGGDVHLRETPQRRLPSRRARGEIDIGAPTRLLEAFHSLRALPR